MKKKIYWAILIGMLALAILTSPLYAIANPDSISIDSGEVFQNIYETGDMLFVMRGDTAYASEPSEDVSDAFLMTLIDTDNTTLLLSREMNQYQESVNSIYASAAQVASLGLVWESAYRIRLTGNPALFPVLLEGTNLATKTLALSDWNADGTLTSLELLRLHCLDIAAALETALATTLTTTTAEGNTVLNSAGTALFLEGMPGLSTPLPELFQLSSAIPRVPSTKSNATYALQSRIDNRLGPAIGGALTGIGTFLGIGQNSAAGLWAIIFLLTIASIVFLNTSNSSAALVLAIPVVVLLTYLGAIAEAITYVLAILIATYAFYYFWLRGT
jgi:hypothetical protein